MDLSIIATGVLIGNMLTVWFVWGAYHAFKRDEKDLRMVAYLSILAPLGLAILSMIANGFSPIGG